MSTACGSRETLSSSQQLGRSVDGGGVTYVNVSSFFNEELHHLQMAKVCADVQRFPAVVQGLVHVRALKGHSIGTEIRQF